jgi:hypothetical protein
LLDTFDPASERVLDSLALTGRVAPPVSDSILVVNQNASANKVDYYLHRSLNVHIRLTPVMGRGPYPNLTVAETDLTAHLTNDAPASGLSDQVIGPYTPDFRPGENRSFVSIYSPSDFQDAEANDLSTTLESATELGRNVYSTFLSLPSKAESSLHVRLQGTVALDPGGWYQLDLQRQATLFSDAATVDVSLPKGWRIDAVQGLRRTGGQAASGKITLDADHVIRVKIERTGVPGLWDRLRSGDR